LIAFYQQEEEARTRGTPVTVESFKIWKIKFDQELAVKKAKEDEEKMKGLTPKEREEFKKIGIRLSGKRYVVYSRIVTFITDFSRSTTIRAQPQFRRRSFARRRRCLC
jgi:hypothetical protein